MKIVSKPNSIRINKTGSWRTYQPVFLHDKCIACGKCSSVCPEGIIKKVVKKDKAYYECDLDYCKGCGLCDGVCPVNAIQMKLG